MSSRGTEIFSNICISCVVGGLALLALVTVATLVWVGLLQ